MGIDEVIAKLGVRPRLIPELKAICGDASDNITGIKGIGPKTAVKLIEEAQGDWKAVLSHPKIAPHSQMVVDNLNLTKSVLVREVFAMSPNDFVLGTGTFQQIDVMFERFHFTSLIKRRKKILALLDINDGVKDVVQ